MDQPLLINAESKGLKDLSLFTYAYRYTFEPELLTATLASFNERYLACITQAQLDHTIYHNKILLKQIRSHLKKILISKPLMIQKTHKSANLSMLLGQSLAHTWFALIRGINAHIEYQQELDGWVLPMQTAINTPYSTQKKLDLIDLFHSKDWNLIVDQIENQIHAILFDFTLKKSL